MLTLLLSSLALGLNVQNSQTQGNRGATLLTTDKKAGQLRKTESHSFVRSLEFKHRLRICNAYPYDTAMDVFRAKDKLTDEPMKYKDCREFKIQLLAGDKLKFKTGDADVGSFAVATMPENDGVLLLVISRHDALSTAVSFESHIFANLLNAQVAVIDTYKGESKATLKIQDHDKARTARSEELRYDSVVAVNPGKFDVVLYNDAGVEKKKTELIALNREAYVILRVGVEAQKGPPFPEEIVVFPHSDESLLGGAQSISTCATLLSLFLMAI